MNKYIGKVIMKVYRVLNSMKFLNSQKQIKKLKNIYSGHRCFIVGSGPSLQMEDLEMIKNEITFGTHRIYQIFDKTKWRPTFYCAQDSVLINDSADEICKIAKSISSFIAIVPERRYRPIKNAMYMNFLAKDFYPEFPEFSDDVSRLVVEGCTVTYMCLQIAAYMGFSEIYLIGVDHNYSTTLSPDGKIQHNDGVKDHFSDKDVITNVPALYKSTLAYEKAQEYAEKHGIKIYNATRGGKLEVFERVNFDDIIKN